ncbi:MAG: LTA synthase family protein [Firmicutes bacterium]|nr:LTA synthase family protein [Bacillota bacterium]
MNIIKLLIFSSILILIQEFLSKKDIKKVFMIKPHYFVANILILFDIILLFSMINQNYYPILQIIILVIIALSIANRIKIDYRQTGFTPKDFLIFKEAKSMTGALNKRSMLYLIVSSSFSLIVLLVSSLNIKYTLLSKTISVLIISASILLILFFYIFGPRYNQKISIYKVGSIFYFFSYLNDPPKIKVTKRERIIDDNKDIDFEGPDIIIIQSESFVDPLTLGLSKYNKDPLPFYRSLLNETYSFSMSTRAFGGGTVHTEYEILTGLSTILFPRDTTVFSSYIKAPLPSIGSILKKQGYDSLLIHPYLEWYYKRMQVYKRLGFDKFLSGNSFPNEGNQYINDIDVFKKILNELDDGNKLIVGVTMQNHTPYNNQRYNNDIKYLGDFTNKETYLHFNNFLDGIAETDKALKFLINQLRKRKRETLLLFYGDHLPVINQDASFYEESEWSKAKFDSWKYHYDLSKSPGFIWSNKVKIESKFKNIDATAILPSLLKETGCNYPDYLKTLGNLFENESINGLFRNFIIKNDSFYGSDSPEYKKIYKLVKDINNDVFNNTNNDKWCFENKSYTVN